MCVCACVFLCHAFLGTTRIHAYMHVHIHNVDVVQASKSLRASDPVSHARRIFKRLDVNNSGSLEAEELQQAVHRIEDEMTDREVLLRRMELIQDQLAATQHAQATAKVKTGKAAALKSIFRGIDICNVTIFIRHSLTR